jgi:hypothetical protein
MDALSHEQRIWSDPPSARESAELELLLSSQCERKLHEGQFEEGSDPRPAVLQDAWDVSQQAAGQEQPTDLPVLADAVQAERG